MNDDEKEIKPEDSFRLITSMIETAKQTIGDQSHFYLLWGWAVMIGCLLQYYLKAVADYRHHYYAWFVTPIATVIHFYFLARQERKTVVRTFVADATRYLWLAICMAFVVLSFIFTKIGWQYCFPFYILFYGIGTFVSGSLLKFKPFIVGGICSIIISAITPYVPYDYQILMTGFSILISYIIPGHMLRVHYHRNKNFQNGR
ncbi:MAG TPA: hypothetical protein VF622_11445 [Segetibacter sp.]|jgi:hypothetical protein